MIAGILGRSMALGTAVTVWAAATTVAARQQARPEKPPQAIQAPLKEAELARVGEEVTDKACASQCHEWDKIEARRTSREWDDVIADMMVRGAQATTAQVTIIKQFMKRYYGLVSVNAASAAEFSAVLGLSAKDAEAIVAYRKAHGKFADAAALLKVPGIDRAKIESQPDALRFN